MPGLTETHDDAHRTTDSSWRTYSTVPERPALVSTGVSDPGRSFAGIYLASRTRPSVPFYRHLGAHRGRPRDHFREVFHRAATARCGRGAGQRPSGTHQLVVACQ